MKLSLFYIRIKLLYGRCTIYCNKSMVIKHHLLSLSLWNAKLTYFPKNMWLMLLLKEFLHEKNVQKTSLVEEVCVCDCECVCVCVGMHVWFCVCVCFKDIRMSMTNTGRQYVVCYKSKYTHLCTYVVLLQTENHYIHKMRYYYKAKTK